MLQQDRASCRASLECVSREYLQPLAAREMIALLFFSALLWDEARAWGFKDGVLHNSIWLGKK